ncbi:5-formyltetrahydrofolate cyclo-ligase [Janibacter massiliensis]|uniref:5-formyltetrahydrofolate cyclo-ligase n=1 Tax=Janibacter massiliensis TaxID=2058291 RepID=UPI001F23B224|nr:5-formyltetrahydrofolate cyclo-ligase [Janibacter massiliensis]
MTHPTAADKRLVRAQRREERRRITAARDLDADGPRLAAHVLDLLDRLGIGAGATVTAYESTPIEPPTADLVAMLAARDVRVLVPITLPDLDLDWCDAGDPDRTTLGPDAVLAANVVLAPGLSVDGGGTRLGQGGGCYDRVLARLAAAGRGDVPVVTLLHPGELLADPLPLEPHDRAVDAVVTADGCTALPVSTPPWTADPPGTPA